MLRNKKTKMKGSRPRLYVAALTLFIIGCLCGMNSLRDLRKGISKRTEMMIQHDNDNEGNLYHHLRHIHLHAGENNSTKDSMAEVLEETDWISRDGHQAHRDSHLPIPSRHNVHQAPVNISIVVPLRFQMGNHLSQIAHGYGVLLEARRNGDASNDLEAHTDTDMKLVLLQQPQRDQKNQTKYYYHQSLKDLHRCFPKLRPLLFGKHGNTTINHVKYDYNEQQKGILSADQWYVNHTSKITSSLRSLKEWLLLFSSLRENGSNPIHSSISHVKKHKDTLLYITVDMDYVAVNYLVDKYYEEYRTLFQFNHTACCKLKPDPDESVYHFRNYASEMRHLARIRGFEELDTRRVANDLFGHLQPGDKVAITTRFQSRLHRLVQALTNRGLQVRVIKQQSGVEDFCFLLHAQKELVGVAESTFVLWAGYLGNANKVRLYSVDSPARRNASTSLFAHRVFVHYNWTNPNLKQKVFFELYKVNKTKR